MCEQLAQYLTEMWLLSARGTVLEGTRANNRYGKSIPEKGNKIYRKQIETSDSDTVSLGLIFFLSNESIGIVRPGLTLDSSQTFVKKLTHHQYSHPLPSFAYNQIPMRSSCSDFLDQTNP